MRRVGILVLGNGAAGAEKQALALSARLEFHLSRKGAIMASGVDGATQLVRVPMKDSAFIRPLPPICQIVGARLTRDPFFGYAPTETQKRLLLGLDEHFATHRRVVIGCGRTTVALCAALKQQRPGAHVNSVFNIQIQHPRAPLSLFDAVITPRHDALGKASSSLPANLHLTFGTVCSLDRRKMQVEGDKWSRIFDITILRKKLRIAWLIGGPCRGFAFSEDDASDMADQVLDIVHRHRPDVSLIVTFSRRTPLHVQVTIKNRLQRDVSGSELFIWDGHGANPFEAMLHHATAIVTTPDSISMTTEAVAMGKPVFTVGSDRISGKFLHFHEVLRSNRFVLPLGVDGNGSLPIDNLSRGRQAIETELDQITAALAAQILHG